MYRYLAIPRVVEESLYAELFVIVCEKVPLWFGSLIIFSYICKQSKRIRWKNIEHSSMKRWHRKKDGRDDMMRWRTSSRPISAIRQSMHRRKGWWLTSSNGGVRCWKRVNLQIRGLLSSWNCWICAIGISILISGNEMPAHLSALWQIIDWNVIAARYGR